MISTKNLIGHINDVPREWVFEYYLNLREKLCGQDVKILSVFNSKDSVPSMFIYFDTSSNEYKFKDFSSGYQGDHIQLVLHLFNLPVRWKATYKIINDYSEYLKTHKRFDKVEIKFHSKYQVSDYQIRSWNNLDAKYWTNFGISSNTLKKYNVHPLEFFTMSKEEDGKAYTILLISIIHMVILEKMESCLRYICLRIKIKSLSRFRIIFKVWINLHMIQII